jgi:hypothetical protein
MNRPRIFLVGAVTVILLALLVACGGDDDDATTPASASQSTPAVEAATEAPDEEATTEESSGSADEATEEPTEEEATAEPEETAATDDSNDDPTPTAEDEDDNDDVRIVGSAQVEDDTDDVSNILMQEPDDPMPGIDLTMVRIEADGEQIVVTIETASDIADQFSEDVDISFDVHLWQDNRPAYALSFHHNGTDDWEASVTDFSTLLGDEETIDTEIEMSGNTLTAAFPTSMLEDLEAEFEWYSSVILSEGGMMIGPNSWFDGAPENVIALLADPEEFVEFPQ